MYLNSSLRFYRLQVLIISFLLGGSVPFIAPTTWASEGDLSLCQFAADDALASSAAPVFRRLTDQNIREALFGSHPVDIRWRLVYFRRALLLLYQQDHLGQAELVDTWLNILRVMGAHSGFQPTNYRFDAPDGSQVFHNGSSGGHAMVIDRDGRIFRFEDGRLNFLAVNWRPNYSAYKHVNGTDVNRRRRYWNTLAADANIPTPEFSELERMLGLPDALLYHSTEAWPVVRDRLWERREAILRVAPAPDRELVLAERLNAILARYPRD